MDWIITLLVNSVVLLGLAYALPQVEVKSFKTALFAALLIGILNATVGFLIRLPLNIVTLGLLTFVVRLIVTAIIIKLVDLLMKGLTVRGFWPALLIAIVLAIVSHFLTYLLD